MKTFALKTGCRKDGQQQRARLLKRGFSLLEFSVVVALVLVLGVMYSGWLTVNHGKQGRKGCQSNLQKIYVSLQIYATDHGGTYPTKADAKTSEEPLSLLVPRYDADLDTFICPASKDKPLPAGGLLVEHKVSYAYYMGLHALDTQAVLMSDAQVDTTSKAAGQSIFSSTGKPPGNNHQKSGGNVLFGDGRAEFSPPNTVFSIVYSPGVVLLNPKP